MTTNLFNQFLASVSNGSNTRAQLGLTSPTLTQLAQNQADPIAQEEALLRLQQIQQSGIQGAAQVAANFPTYLGRIALMNPIPLTGLQVPDTLTYANQSVKGTYRGFGTNVSNDADPSVRAATNTKYQVPLTGAVAQSLGLRANPKVQINALNDDALAVLAAAGIQLASPLTRPGSAQSKALNAMGLPGGLITVQNPIPRSGSRIGGKSRAKGLSPGSKGFFTALNSYNNNPAAYKNLELDMIDLIGQAAFYYFSDIFASFGYKVLQTTDGYVVVDSAGDPLTVEDFLANTELVRDIQNEYNLNYKDGDKIRTGTKGSTANALYNNQYTSYTVGGQAIPNNATPQLAQKITAAQRSGQFKGLLHKTADSQTAQQRRGQFLWKMSDAQGNPMNVSTNYRNFDYRNLPNGASCRVGTSGPGITQGSSANFVDGGHYTAKARTYRGKGRSDAGLLLSDNKNISCAITPDYAVNPLRDVYQVGGSRGTATTGLRQAYDNYNNASNANYRGQYGGPDVTLENNLEAYNDFIDNPQNYGVNPAFTASGKFLQPYRGTSGQLPRNVNLADWKNQNNLQKYNQQLVRINQQKS